MEFIVNQSSLPIGNTIREHIENPNVGGTGGSLILMDGLEIEVDDKNVELEIDPFLLELEIDTKDVELEISVMKFELEVS